jgi:2-polyprenyl-3-methyl-5-hydroxy-6-metoxy-1,4-benzoquinol methylase
LRRSAISKIIAMASKKIQFEVPEPVELPSSPEASKVDRAAFRDGVFDAYRSAKGGSSADFALQLYLRTTGNAPIECAGKTVLDVACGQRNPFFSDQLKRASKVIGVDCDSAVVRQNPLLHVGIVADLHSIPLPEESVDVVVSVDTIEHAHDPAIFLAECCRVLRNGGRAVFTTPNLFGYRTLLARYGGKTAFDLIWKSFKHTTLPYDSLYRANTPNRVRRLAEQAGLRLVWLETIPELSHFFYPYPMVFAAARAWDKLLEAFGLAVGWNYMAYVLEKQHHSAM